MRRNRTNRRNSSTLERGGSIGSELDRIRELETENALLRARVAELNRRIDQQIVASVTAGDDRSVGTPADGPAGRQDDHMAADEDEDLHAFEAFLAESDPHIDRVQRFLLG